MCASGLCTWRVYCLSDFEVFFPINSLGKSFLIKCIENSEISHI
jgi:hypothetical protein